MVVYVFSIKRLLVTLGNSLSGMAIAALPFDSGAGLPALTLHSPRMRGPRFAEVYRQQARMLAKVLRGTKPADLPVEPTTKFELAINRRTAKALGFTLPLSLLDRSVEMIE